MMNQTSVSGERKTMQCHVFTADVNFFFLFSYLVSFAICFKVKVFSAIVL
jgi:hypothetical protein